jgi:hypothetical protein
VNDVDAVSPTPSVATHVTVVDPTGNDDPDGGVHATVGVLRASVAVGTG